MTTLNSEKKGAAQSNAIQGESFKRKNDNENLKRDLIEQMKQRHAQTTLEKEQKKEQEKIVIENDNLLKKQHTIMQA